jgi:hypothetical protein
MQYPGAHEPLISQESFDRVRDIMLGKSHSGPHKHDFLFRRLFKCDHCGFTLIPERQKGHVYYRCQTRDCPMTTVREEVIQDEVNRSLERLRLSDSENKYFSAKVEELKTHWGEEENKMAAAIQLKLTQTEDRLNRLIDAYVDGHLDPDSFTKRKTTLHMEGQALQSQLQNLQTQKASIPDKIREFLELANNACLRIKLSGGKTRNAPTNHLEPDRP